MYKLGDLIVARLTRHSTCPCQAAGCVAPSEKGEGYSYTVDKYWVVVATRGADRLLVRTRRGKVFEIPAQDTRLRLASWTERVFRRHRFARVERVPPSRSSLFATAVRMFVYRRRDARHALDDPLRTDAQRGLQASLSESPP